jgi:hypothetical protein
VLYNGTDSFHDEQVLRLSDVFESLKELGFEEKDSPSLELVVRMVNVVYNQNIIRNAG